MLILDIISRICYCQTSVWVSCNCDIDIRRTINYDNSIPIRGIGVFALLSKSLIFIIDFCQLQLYIPKVYRYSYSSTLLSKSLIAIIDFASYGCIYRKYIGTRTRVLAYRNSQRLQPFICSTTLNRYS